MMDSNNENLVNSKGVESGMGTEYVLSPKNEASQQQQPNIENPTSYSKDEMTAIWELEVWKKSEQTKFKAYLKQLELEYMNKISEEITLKETEREKQVRGMTNDLQLLQTKARKKLLELESRENKVKTNNNTR